MTYAYPGKGGRAHLKNDEDEGSRSGELAPMFDEKLVTMKKWIDCTMGWLSLEHNPQDVAFRGIHRRRMGKALLALCSYMGIGSDF